MQNGKLIAFILTLAGICCFKSIAQLRDTVRFNTDEWPSFKIDQECKSKSERTAKPTIIKFKKEKLAAVKTVKQLIADIPEQCEVLCVVVSIKLADNKLFEFRNIGNDMVYADRLTEGKVIMVEHLATSCPTLHKANFKIMVEDGVTGK